MNKADVFFILIAWPLFLVMFFLYLIACSLDWLLSLHRKADSEEDPEEAEDLGLEAYL